MRCPSCGNENRQGSLFCQHCGTRLEPSAKAEVSPHCSRCGHDNRPGMRFCVRCGNNLHDGAAAGDANASPAASSPGSMRAAPAQPVGGGAATPTPMAQSAHAPPKVAETVCRRCRGVGDAGAEFCKFCGARYADGHDQPDAAAPAMAPTTDGRSEPAQLRGGVDPTVESPQNPTVSPVAATHCIVSIRKDGSDGPTYPLASETMDFGQSEGDVLLTDDPYLSPRHFRIVGRGDAWLLRDLDSANGVYVRMRGQAHLEDGDRILLGQQVLRFELLDDAELPLGPGRIQGALAFGTPEVPRFARLVLYTTEGVGRDVYYLYRDETVLGRETGDIVFTDDPFLSRRHATIRFARAEQRATLADVGSSNGTCLRLRGEHALQVGDQFRVGRHLFRFDRWGGA